MSESLLSGLQDVLAASKLPASGSRKSLKPLPNLLAIMLRKTRTGVPAIYQPIAQAMPAESFVLLVRTKGDPREATRPLQEMIDRTFAKELRSEGSRIVSPGETAPRI